MLELSTLGSIALLIYIVGAAFFIANLAAERDDL
jgi:hypothetical protein